MLRAVEIRVPLDDYITAKVAEYNRDSVTSTRRARLSQSTEERKPRLFITEEGLTSRDWEVINDYVSLLKPFKEATSWLEGRGGAGSCGAIWEVLPTFDYLIQQLEALQVRFEEVDFEDRDAPEDHLLINLKAALKKLQKYYTKMRVSPAYYTACRLHPSYKNYLDASWAVPEDYKPELPHPKAGWLSNAHRGFRQLWKAHKDELTHKEARNEDSEPPPQKRVRTPFSSSRSDFMRGVLQEVARKDTVDDEFEHWKLELPLDENHSLARDPIKYWLSKEDQYPILSKFALDILSIPAAATSCERSFSELGDLLDNRRLRMLPDLLSALQSLRSWKRLGLRPAEKPYKAPTTTPCQEATMYDIGDDFY